MLHDLRTIARALGGDVAGGQVLAPGPGHGPRDRSFSVRLSATAPDGFIAFSHSGDDWQECPDYICERLGLRRDYTSKQRKPRREGRHPRICSVLALFRNIVTDEPQAISRTFLDREGRKIERKFLGPVAGAAVMMDANENVLGGLHIGEGVETCMAARQLGLRPTWALGSAGAVAAFPVLPGIEALNVIVDHDANGAGEKAAREVEARWLAAGREVNLIRSDTPGDLNDALKGGFQ